LPAIDSIKFDTTGWKLEEVSLELMRWTNAKNEFLSLSFLEVPPDVPCHLPDIDGLRDSYRIGLANSGAALISADVFPIGRLDCIRLIFKMPLQPSGMVYVGTLTFPFEEFSYVVRVQCAELGTTGVRDAMVLDMLIQQGVVAFDMETQTIAGWAADPYDSSFIAPLLSNLSDQETFDTMFPDHPLTDVRAHLHTILLNIHADEEVMLSPRFVGPTIKARTRDQDPRYQTKPWWQFWK
jgi:hypothetical protein